MAAENKIISDIDGFLDGRPLDECLGEYDRDSEKPQKVKRAIGRKAFDSNVNVEETYSVEIDGLYFFRREEHLY